MLETAPHSALADLVVFAPLPTLSIPAESSGLYRDAIDVFLPRLIALVKEIPLPRIEFKSADVDFVVDDLSIKSASFIPDSIRIIQHNDLSLTQGYAAYGQ